MFHRIVPVVSLLTGIVLAGVAISRAADPAPAPIKVGLLVTGSTSDGGWNQLAGDSLAKLAKDGKVETRVLQQVSKDKAADQLRLFDSRGFDVVFAHGYEYLDVVKELTDPTKPNALKLKVAVSGGDSDSTNFQSLDYDLGPASYQLGIIAAKVSANGKLAFIGGAPFPTVTAMKRGFEAGAKSVNPNVTVAEQYTGWDDPAKAKKQVEAFIQQGCDVIMQNVDSASSGVFEAIAEQNGKLMKDFRFPVYTFGANSDQNDNKICPNYTLASAVIKMDLAFAKVAEQAKAGTFKGGLIKEDLASGVCVAVLNPKLKASRDKAGVISMDAQTLLAEATKKLAAGDIKIPEK